MRKKTRNDGGDCTRVYIYIIEIVIGIYENPTGRQE